MMRPMDYLKIETSSINEFKKENSRKVDLANSLIDLSELVRAILLQCEFDSFHEHLLIQEICIGFRESLLYCMRSEPQLALSMGRIASEKSRDLLRILDNPELIKLYSEGRKSKENRKSWQKEFRFRDEEKELLFLYNIGSDFGVHSTIAITDFLPDFQEVSGKEFSVISQKNHSKNNFILIMLVMHLAFPRFVSSAHEKIRNCEEAYALGVSFSNKWKKLIPALETQRNILNKKRNSKKRH